MQTPQPLRRSGCLWVGLLGISMILFCAMWPHAAEAGIPTVYPVGVVKSGSGAGTVTSSGLAQNINCGATCTGGGLAGSSVTLSAVADGGSTFVGWSGMGCGGTGSCAFALTQASVVVAMFGPTGASGFSAADLAGTWDFIQASDPTAGTGPSFASGSMDVDATGAITGGSGTNSKTGAFAITGGRLLIDGKGVVAGTAMFGPDQLIFPAGKLDPTKNILGLGSSSYAQDVGKVIAMRRDGTYTASDLAGSWYLVGMANNAASTGAFWLAGSMIVDPDGYITGGTCGTSNTEYINFNGGSLDISSSGAVSGSASATVGLNPRTLTFDYGKLDPSKNVLGLTLQIKDGATVESVGVIVGIKYGGTFTTSDLAGTWYFVETGNNPTANDPSWSLATVTVDAAGNITGGQGVNSDGDAIAINDGSLTLFGSSGSVEGSATSTVGGVSTTLTFDAGKLDPSKNMLVLTVTESTGDIGVMVGIKGTPAVPPPATLVGPSGSGIGATPIYSWQAVPGATWYEIWVADSTQYKKLDIWYTAAGVGCAGGGICYVAPSVPLAAGNAMWWIQWWGETTSYGTWSDGMAFNVSLPSNMAPLVSPSGAIATATPTYTWQAVPGMTWYYLWVQDPTGAKVQVWMEAATAGCASGTGTCSYTPSTALVLGPATWWIQVWSPAGYGPWSDGLGFTVTP